MALKTLATFSGKCIVCRKRHTVRAVRRISIARAGKVLDDQVFELENGEVTSTTKFAATSCCEKPVLMGRVGA